MKTNSHNKKFHYEENNSKQKDQFFGYLKPDKIRRQNAIALFVYGDSTQAT